MEHYYTISDSCISLAEMIIKHKSLPSSDSYFGSIDMLGGHGIIPADVDYVIVCEKSLNKLPEIKEYLLYIRASLDIS